MSETPGPATEIPAVKTERDSLLPKMLRKLRWRSWLFQKLELREKHGTLLFAGIVGLLGGLSSWLFREGIIFIQWQFSGHYDDLVVAAQHLNYGMKVLIPTVGGLLAGTVLHWGTRLVKGQTSADYMEAVVVGDGMIRSRPTLVKSISSLLTISSGGSIGREGAMVQLSAMWASWLGRHSGQSQARLRLMVACGAAAGIASAYNAPIAAALFVAEIVLGTIAMESFGPLICATVTASLTSRYLLGTEPIFGTPSFQLVSAAEMPIYVLIGLVTGACAPPFRALLRMSEKMFAEMNIFIGFRLAMGGMMVGALSITTPEVWGNGQSVINSLLHAKLAWTAVVTILLLKVTATSFTVGSGAVGGVFTPSLLVGAAIGYLIGVPVHALWPVQTATPSAYALVGMGCFLAGSTHAPLMAVLMVFEMTLDYAITLPLMLGCVTAYYTAQSVQPKSIYDDVLRRKLGGTPIAPKRELTAGDLMTPNPPNVAENAGFGEIARLFSGSLSNNLYVVDQDGHFQGIIFLPALKDLMTETAIGTVVIAHDVMSSEFPTLTPQSSLAEAAQEFAKVKAERLPVISNRTERKLVGALSKTDLLLTLAHGTTGAPGAKSAPAAANQAGP